MSNEESEEQPENIEDMSVTFPVRNIPASKTVRLVQPLNMEVISVT